MGVVSEPVEDMLKGFSDLNAFLVVHQRSQEECACLMILGFRGSPGKALHARHEIRFGISRSQEMA